MAAGGGRRSLRPRGTGRHEERKRPTVEACELREFDDIHAALSALALRYVRLRPPECLSYVRLFEARASSSGSKPLEEKLIGARMDGTHEGWPERFRSGCALSLGIPNWNTSV